MSTYSLFMLIGTHCHEGMRINEKSNVTFDNA